MVNIMDADQLINDEKNAGNGRGSWCVEPIPLMTHYERYRAEVDLVLPLGLVVGLPLGLVVMGVFMLVLGEWLWG